MTGSDVWLAFRVVSTTAYSRSGLAESGVFQPSREHWPVKDDDSFEHEQASDTTPALGKMGGGQRHAQTRYADTSPQVPVAHTGGHTCGLAEILAAAFGRVYEV
jgi:hypothetical protein